ncbi:MAG: DUF2189 domain-containing protein [Alphaproteobacteria bacterium]
MTIRNPLEWTTDQLGHAMHGLGAARHAIHPTEEELGLAPPEVRRIAVADVAEALRAGARDFAACRTDVMFIGIVYATAGLLIARIAAGADMLPLIFPLVSGFALLGPVAAAGLYEMSRRRERGEAVGWGDAFGVFASPSIAAIATLGLVLAILFALWLAAAMGLYAVTLGPEMPASAAAFAEALFGTAAGWTLIVVGIGVGALFALAALTIGVVSFPLLLDRRVRVTTAVGTSIRAVARNPLPMLVWGAVVAGTLLLGALPLLLGLIVVIPVLGHATWHLYRRVVA